MFSRARVPRVLLRRLVHTHSKPHQPASRGLVSFGLATAVTGLACYASFNSSPILLEGPGGLCFCCTLCRALNRPPSQQTQPYPPTNLPGPDSQPPIWNLPNQTIPPLNRRMPQNPQNLQNPTRKIQNNLKRRATLKTVRANQHSTQKPVKSIGTVHVSVAWLTDRVAKNLKTRFLALSSLRMNRKASTVWTSSRRCRIALGNIQICILLVSFDPSREIRFTKLMT